MGMTLDEQHEYIRKAASEFPASFGLAGFPGETFRIGLRQSYFVDFSPTPSSTMYLYTQRLDANGEWQDFAKGTPAELRRQVVSAPKRTAPARSKSSTSSTYEVIVGNVGRVLTTTSRSEAEDVYDEYVDLSKAGGSRASDEDVTLMRDGEPVREHTGSRSESP